MPIVAKTHLLWMVVFLPMIGSVVIRARKWLPVHTCRLGLEKQDFLGPWSRVIVYCIGLAISEDAK